jgi:hypothetical protein
MTDIRQLASFALSVLKTAATNEDALKAIVGRIGTAAGGATQAELDTALAGAVAGRKKAGQGMQDAGKARS